MGLPCFSSCYGLLSFLLVLLPIVTGIPIPLNSDLVRRYWEGSDLFTGDSLDFTSTQGSSDLSMSGADTNGSGDGPPMDWGLGDDPSVDWGLGDHPIKLEGGLGNDALNTDDGSFQLAASFNGDQSNNCQIRFRSGDCKNGQPQDTSVSSPAPQTPPTEQPGPELVPVPQDPEANCQIRLGCKADGTPNAVESSPPITPLEAAGGAVLGAGATLFLWGQTAGTGLAPLINLSNQ